MNNDMIQRELYAVRMKGTNQWWPKGSSYFDTFDKAQIFHRRNAATSCVNSLKKGWQKVDAEVVPIHVSIIDTEELRKLIQSWRDDLGPPRGWSHGEYDVGYERGYETALDRAADELERLINGSVA